MTLKQKLTYWAYSLALFFSALFGCGLLPAAAPPPGRALCYAAADQNAQARVDKECHVGELTVPFAECPAHDEIMAELKASQESCR